MAQALRTLVVLAVLGAFARPAHGQFNFNLGVELARPTSGLADLVDEDYGYGAHAALTYWLNYDYQLIASGGYVTYGSEVFESRTDLEDLVDQDQDLDGVVDRIEGDYTSIPVTVGLRFYPLERLFLQGSAGVVYKRTRQKDDAGANEAFVTKRDLIVSPGIGLLLGRFSLQAQYNLARNDWKWFSLGVSMIFGKL